MSGPSVRQAITTSTRATALHATVLLTSCQHTNVTTAPSPTSATTAYVVDGDTFAITPPPTKPTKPPMSESSASTPPRPTNAVAQKLTCPHG